MRIGSALRRMVGLEAKAAPAGAVPTAEDAKMSRLWGRVLGFGPTAAGKLVTPDTAMQVSAFWACVKLLSETIATLPLTIYRREADGGRSTAPDHPLSALLKLSPDGEHTAVEFWEGVVLSMCLNGDAFAEKVRVGGRLVALQPMRADLVTVRRSADGRLLYAFADPLGARLLDEADVFHLRAFGNAGLRGFSPLMFARQTVAASMAADESANKLFANGVRPSGVLQVDQILKPEQRRDLRENIVAPLAGSANAGGVFVLEGGMKFTPISLSPADSQLLETRRWHVEEIARWFGIPPILIGHASQGQTMWGSGVEQIVLSWLTLGLRAQLRRIEAAIHLRLLEPDERRDVYAEFAVEGLLRADSEARAKLYASFAQNGIMDRDEIREKENLARRGGGAAKLTVQSNLLPVDDLGKVASLPRETPVEPRAAEIPTNSSEAKDGSAVSATPFDEVLDRLDACAARLLKTFNPDQPRDDHGRWAGDGSSGGGAGGATSAAGKAPSEAADASERADFKRSVLLLAGGAAAIAGASMVTAFTGGTAPAAVTAAVYIAENFLLAEALNTAVKYIALRSGLTSDTIREFLDGTLDDLGMKSAVPDLATARTLLADFTNSAYDALADAYDRAAAASRLPLTAVEAGHRAIERARSTHLARLN